MAAQEPSQSHPQVESHCAFWAVCSNQINTNCSTFSMFAGEAAADIFLIRKLRILWGLRAENDNTTQLFCKKKFVHYQHYSLVENTNLWAHSRSTQSHSPGVRPGIATEQAVFILKFGPLVLGRICKCWWLRYVVAVQSWKWRSPQRTESTVGFQNSDQKEPAVCVGLMLGTFKHFYSTSRVSACLCWIGHDRV